ncbi:Uncharacterized protein GBIM_17382, partial [Gryllus bimaculatus]
TAWALVLAVGAGLALYLVLVAWERYERSPMLIAVETSQYPIWNTPFPAVTICSLNKVELSAARRLVSTWELPPGATRAQVLSALRLVPLLGDAPSSVAQLRPHLPQLRRLQATLRRNNVTPADLVHQVGAK